MIRVRVDRTIFLQPKSINFEIIDLSNESPISDELSEIAAAAISDALSKRPRGRPSRPRAIRAYRISFFTKRSSFWALV